MNEPLKYKLFSVYGQLLSRNMLMEAWKHVKANKGAGGADGVSLKDFEKHLDANIDDLLASLRNRTYKPSPVRRVYIPKKNGKLRPLGIPTIRDRIVQQALTDRLQPFFEKNVFHDNSCGFRAGRDAELAIKKVITRLEYGYLYIYDFDIKGYFDNIPHKKLMRVLNKYIADGTVLDIIWKSLKAGYMEDSVVYETAAGTMQGGVISPLLANIYLNELDWELDKAGLQFVRYADDSIVMCRTPEELEKAKTVVHRVLAELGLQLAEDKTDEIDFHHKDFNYLNFTFRHLRTSSRGRDYYVVEPSKKAIQKFKSDLKAVTGKKLSNSHEQWTQQLNPILRGKYNYFLIAGRACKAVQEALAERGRPFHGCPYKGYAALDGYVRQRLRVNFANRGKRHAKTKDGRMYHVKYGIAFFAGTMKLTCGQYLYNLVWRPDLTIEQFLEEIKEKQKQQSRKSKPSPAKDRYFKFAYAK